ncbi:MAG TPA: hypothetical protein VFZ58_02240 [Candidatus Saccharimonadales bacterium]
MFCAFVLRVLYRDVLGGPKRRYDRPLAIVCLFGIPLLLLETVLGARSNEAEYAPAAAAATASIEHQLELMDMRPASGDAIKVNFGSFSRTSHRASVTATPGEHRRCQVHLEAHEHSGWRVGVVLNGEFVPLDSDKALRAAHVKRQCAAPAR